MLALAVIETPSDAVSRKKKITHARLHHAGVLAAERAKQRVKDALQLNEAAIPVECAYQGPEEKEEERNLHSLMRVKYLWSTPSGSVEHWVFISRALHAGGFRCIPWAFQLPLLASHFPARITQQRLVPAMRDKEGVVCRAVAVPKRYEGEVATTYVFLNGRAVEHMVCAHVTGTTFFVHPGGKLDPHGLILHKIKRSAKKTQVLAPTC